MLVVVAGGQKGSFETIYDHLFARKKNGCLKQTETKTASDSQSVVFFAKLEGRSGFKLTSVCHRCSIQHTVEAI